MDYEGLEIQEAIPEASSMIETFRAIGYNLETAVADIIDNSITAGASRITIQRYWRGGKSVITIIDNGCGMNNEELIHAMRPGAQNPLEERDEKDLGRFGLGLITKSIIPKLILILTLISAVRMYLPERRKTRQLSRRS